MGTYRKTIESAVRHYFEWVGNDYIKKYYTVQIDIYSWYRQHGVKFRERLPKCKASIPECRASDDQAWQRHKGFERDYRKRSGYRYRRRPCRFHKVASNRLRRAYEKAFIYSKDWDNYLREGDVQCIDPWRWD